MRWSVRRQCVAASHRLGHGGHDFGWDDFVCADEDADTWEPCMDEGIVKEVLGKSDVEESDADDDETSEPASTSAPIAITYIEDLKQVV
ncbi:hypothetical protein HPB48_022391 [Haemaphysalis longicornis]|uniref:Uncharacterized protein n=1 Tax=Haemaphysalis longicornis TaxID=44386 RepID=A0A9J6FP46_HAELO|nr:hypothetical protein HPB48_022391 [Haemaphysalis longicornis]